MQRTALLVKKLLIDDKITASVKQICPLGIICKVLDRKTLSNEKFSFLGNVCYQYLNFVFQVTHYFLMSC